MAPPLGYINCDVSHNENSMKNMEALPVITNLMAHLQHTLRYINCICDTENSSLGWRNILQLKSTY